MTLIANDMLRSCIVEKVAGDTAIFSWDVERLDKTLGEALDALASFDLHSKEWIV
jgi:hypothetical protein